MKRKILYIGIISLVAFLIGRNTVEPMEPKQTVQTTQTETKTTLNLSDPKDFDLACDFVGKIIDWNTDGKELAIMTSDGYELYAYKEPNTDVYEGNRIVDVIETDNRKIAIKQNGRNYIIKE